MESNKPSQYHKEAKATFETYHFKSETKERKFCLTLCPFNVIAPYNVSGSEIWSTWHVSTTGEEAVTLNVASPPGDFPLLGRPTNKPYFHGFIASLRAHSHSARNGSADLKR